MADAERWPVCSQCGGRHAELKPGMCVNRGGPLDPRRFKSHAEALAAERQAWRAIGETPPF